MKIQILLILMLVSLTCTTAYSKVNGEILSENDNLTVVKLWGTHAERGYAYGYLMGDKIVSVYEDYLKPQFGTSLSMIKTMIKSGQALTIDDDYIDEAKGIYQGLSDAGFEIKDGDYSDILLANSFLDVMGVQTNLGCSSLLSWGEACSGTEDESKSFITRHLDWDNDSEVVKNQVLVIHIPSEVDEQPWAMISFAGLMSCLSGANSSGLSAFQHMMGDYDETSTAQYPYEAIWFSLRNALESKDYNADGINNTADVRAALNASTNGYAGAYIVSALAKGNNQADSLIAMIAEVAPNAPTHTYRSTSYEDNIHGDNIYTANSQIKRNDARNYCWRYTGIVAMINDGTNIDRQKSWDLMKNYSNSGTRNIQLMQFCPDEMELLLSIYENDTPAYRNEPYKFDLEELFNSTSSVENNMTTYRKHITIAPVPVNKEELITFNIDLLDARGFMKIFDVSGKLILSEQIESVGSCSALIDDRFTAGTYTLIIESEGKVVASEKFIVK